MPMDMKACDERRTRNLEVFEERQPALYDQIAAYEPLAQFTLTEDGQPDVIFNDEHFYSKKHDQYVSSQMEAFLAKPQIFELVAPSPESYDDYAGAYIDAFLRAAIDKDISFHAHRQTRNAHFLVIFGLGLGGFIDELMEELNPQCVIFVEPNLEFLHHSLKTYDWGGLFDKISERKGELQFIVAPTAEELTYSLRRSLRAHSPCSVDGMAWYMHYNAPVLNGAMQQTRDDSELIITGLGFLYDETLMLGNTHRNLRGGNAKVYQKPDDGKPGVPVFVVGCGPSLDKDLEAIKANQSKAVIISCGSAIGPLASAGIVPDFQMEIENLNIFTIMEKIWEKIDLKKVCLIASSTADPEINPLFDRIVYYFRSALSPYPLFSADDRHVVKFSSPTVVNAGLGLAQELGFRQIYLFGADMGVKDKDMHHAANSYHYTENAILYEHNYNIEIQGNFGGKVVTSSSFYWARDAIIQSIRATGLGVRHFNCSDGAEINFCLPKTSRSLELDDIPDGKAAVVDKIFETFPNYGRDHFDAAWNDEYIRENMNGYMDNIRDTVLEAEDLSDPAFLREIYVYLVPGAGLGGKEDYTRMSMAMALLFRGSIFMMIIALLYYRDRIGDEEKEKIFNEIAREKFLEKVETMREYALEHVGYLTERSDESADENVDDDATVH